MSPSNAAAKAWSDSTEVVFVRFFARVERELGRLDEPLRGIQGEVEVAVEVCFEILPARVALARGDGMVAVSQGQ